MSPSTLYDDYFQLELEHLILIGMRNPYEGIPSVETIRDWFGDSGELSPTRLHNETQTALDVIISTQTFRTGVYGYKESTGSWEEIDIEWLYNHHEHHISEITSGEENEYRDEFKTNLFQAADSLGQKINERIDTGHGRTVSVALAEKHLFELV